MSCYELPVWMRKPVLGLYVRAFGCDMKEALVEDLRNYPSLSHLFTRQLKHGSRTISSEHELVSLIFCMTEILNVLCYSEHV